MPGASALSRAAKLSRRARRKGSRLKLPSHSSHYPFHSEVGDMHTQLRIFFAAILFLTGAALLIAPGAAARADADAVVGTWEGTWTGSSTGKLEMTISKGADGKLSGSVSP